MGDSNHYDCIVVGLGGIGSATLYWLTKKTNKRVLGLEQFKLGHVNGGSQDHSRIVRILYDDPKYTKLAEHIYPAWAAAEEESGLQLVYKTGIVMAGHDSAQPPTAMDDCIQALKSQDVEHEVWSGQELHEHFPQFKERDDVRAIYQKDGGLVDAALGNAVHIQLARARGAHIRENCKVVRLEPTADGGCKVFTSDGVFSCRRVIVTAGAWLNHILGSVGVHIPVYITQENVTYIATPNMKLFTKNRFPAFFFLYEDSFIYGLPIHGNSGFKVGFDAAGEIVHPDARTWVPDPQREEAVLDLCKRFIPEGMGPILETKCCLYAMTRDRNFVVDSLAYKDLPQILVCCGAGHSYKFSAPLGMALSELAMYGHTQCDLSGFKVTRSAVQDPNFRPPKNVFFKRYAKL